jgi:protease PrsW
MDRVAVFLAAIVPGLLVLAYGVAITRSSWSSGPLWTAFFVGGVGAVAALPLEFALQALMNFVLFEPLPTLLQAGVTALLIAAVPEEAIKFTILLGIAERHVDVRRLQDIIALALAVSVGFATIENLFYGAIPEEWQSVAAARALTAVPGHGTFGLLMGALVLSARVHSAKQDFRIVLALLVPTFLHAAYDFPLLALKGEPEDAEWLIMVWVAVLLASVSTAIMLCRRVLSVAAEADRLSGRDQREDGRAYSVVVGGCALLVASPLLAIMVFWMRGTSLPWLGAALGVLPAALAIDLIWTGLRRRRATGR